MHNQLIKKLIIKINPQKYNWNANSILNIVYRQIVDDWYSNWEYNPNVNQPLIQMQIKHLSKCKSNFGRNAN